MEKAIAKEEVEARVLLEFLGEVERSLRK